MVNFDKFSLLYKKRSKEQKEKEISGTFETPNNITVFDLRNVEETLTHEIEHSLLYDLTVKVGCNEKTAKFAYFFVSDPSNGDLDAINVSLALEGVHWKRRQKIINTFKVSPFKLVY